MANHYVDENPDYWRDYNNLQHTKHELIREYLNAWLPKLGRWHGRVLYVDTHAGRGKHLSGALGSPLVALKTALDHTHRETHFGRCKIAFHFIERDEANCAELDKEIEALGTLPPLLSINVYPGNCFEVLHEFLDYLKQERARLAPAFIFVDPYGFKIPAALLRELMQYPCVELFVNVIWRWLSMAIAQGSTQPGMAETLDKIYDGEDWRGLVNLEFEEQADASVNLLRSRIGAKWATYIRMLGPNKRTKYMLLHLTNHDDGRDVMKSCFWKVCPEAGWFARVTDNPAQQEFFTPEPDLRPLRQWVIRKLEEKPRRWKDLHEEVRSELWLEKHLNQVVRELRKEKVLDGRKHTGRKHFSATNNPELYLLEGKEPSA